MGEPRTIYLELVASSRMATDLAAGGLFVQDKTLALQDVCTLTVFNDGGQLDLAAKAVYLDGNGGVGLEVIGFGAELKAKLDELIVAGLAAAEAAPVEEPEPVAEPEVSEADVAAAQASVQEEMPVAELESGTDEERAEHKTLHERLRGLTLAEQVKRAKSGGVTERMLLERLYGKNVWEALLRNPALTPPEVARIGRMGSVPRPLLEIIVGNGAWLQIPEVRRALLTNPRLGTDQIIKLLRMMSKQELKLATTQTVYPMAVRSQAKTLLKAEGG